MITSAEVVDVLTPIWLSKAATAKKVREVLEAVFDYAGAKGKRSAPNPAVMKGNLDTLLPQRPTLTRGHHPAVPVAIAPALYARLVDRGGGYVRAETVTLTATRSEQTTLARRGEFDLRAPSSRRGPSRPGVISSPRPKTAPPCRMWCRSRARR